MFTSFNPKMTVFVVPYLRELGFRMQRKVKGDDILHFFCPETRQECTSYDDDVTQSNATFIKEIIEKKRNKKSSKTRRHLFFDLSLRAL